MRTKLLVLVVVFLVVVSLAVACDPKEKSNPFVIGQIVYPSSLYAQEHTESECGLAEEGAQVVDITATLVRVKYADGNIDSLHYSYFTGKDVELHNDWLLGNPFVVGQMVCTVPDSVRESFPDAGVIRAIKGGLIYLEGYENPIAWGHFQACSNKQ